ncbi:MAG: flavodoxin family protein [Oscillospiraceae bacterium]|nr:flavodoxin family protein [Oscillospiraceae bacterium]
MKVLLINGSPRREGCTFTALSIVAEALEENGVEAEIFQAGGTTKGCLGCGYCAKNGKCVTDDCVNEALKKLDEVDGIVIGSPVHYAAASGAATSFMDRFFYAADKSKLVHKVGAAVASARRAGTTATLDQLQKYFTISEMPIVSSRYWPMVHGSNPEQVREDSEGVQVMRVLGKNMAWLIKCIEAGKKEGIEPPTPEQKVFTNFIR